MQPNNLFALEVSCISLQNLGLKQQALNEYESLYLKSDRIDVLYTISFLQFELKKFYRKSYQFRYINKQFRNGRNVRICIKK